MGHVERIEHQDGALQPLASAVQTVVVRGEQDVEACVDASPQIIVGGTELRIARIGVAWQRHLQVGDGHISPLHLVLDTGEGLVVVISTISLQRCLDLRAVLHQVTCKEQAQVMFFRHRYKGIDTCRHLLLRGSTARLNDQRHGAQQEESSKRPCHLICFS